MDYGAVSRSGTAQSSADSSSIKGTDRVEAYQFMYSPSIRITLFNTPGFDDTMRSDTDILEEIAEFLSHTYKQDVLLSGILYFHRIRVSV